MDIRRGFVDVQEGQIHYRTGGTSSGGTPPLVMLHASPGSSLSLVPLVKPLGRTRVVIALDTLGNGDSSRPAPEDPDIAYFAGAVSRALDGLGIARFDLYGTHTGGSIALEIALSVPDRVRKMILDGVSLWTEEERQEMLAHHAPPVQLSEEGTQFLWAWHFVRDRFLFWPWYRRDRAHRRDVEFPSAEALHDMTMEVLKAIRTYHLSYRAAFRHKKVERLPLVTVPTLIAVADTDMLYPYLEDAAALLPGCAKAVTSGTATVEARTRTAELFASFLDS